MHLPKISLVVVASIFTAGAVLNLMGSGTLGTQMQKVAKYITNGYGVN